jgi:hypothetical protein
LNFKSIGILVLGLCFCSDVNFAGNKGWEKSLTYGLFSEKLPMSLIEYSGIYNVNPQSELYFSVGSMLFATGVGSGYKYYIEDKYSNSMYLSSGLFLAYLGTADEGMSVYGFSISPGYSKEFKPQSKSGIYYRDRFAGPLKEVVHKKSSINVGISFLFFGNGSFGALPFIYIEKRF